MIKGEKINALKKSQKKNDVNNKELVNYMKKLKTNTNLFWRRKRKIFKF